MLIIAHTLTSLCEVYAIIKTVENRNGARDSATHLKIVTLLGGITLACVSCLQRTTVDLMSHQH